MRDLRAITCNHQEAALIGQLAMPATPGPWPAILVMHNAHGLGPHMRQVTALLAEEGYVALAADMYGGGVYYDDAKAAAASLEPLWKNPGLLRSRVLAWHDVLKNLDGVDGDRIAAIGYCFGGQCVLELARSGADAKAVVSYHGILTTAEPARPGSVKAQVAVYTGGRDPYAPREHVDALRDEMIAAGAHWQITEFGDACHAFTDPGAAAMKMSGVAFDPLANKVSWAGTLAFLRAILREI